MTITQYARHAGVYLQAVQYAVKAGRIKRQADGMIDSDTADADWQRNTLHTNARKAPRKKTGAAPQARERAAEDAAELASPDRLAGAPDFAKARAAREIYQARMTRLEFEKRNGNLISRAQVEVATANQFRILRDACLNIPNRIAAQIAAETDPVTVHELLEAEVTRVFEAYSIGQIADEPSEAA
jgi:hypothetical protein